MSARQPEASFRGSPSDRRPDGVVGSADVVYGDIDLGLLFGVLLRQWWLIALVLALFVGGGFTYVKTAPKVWQATARVLLDPRDKQVAGPGVTQPVQGIDTFWIDTQADVVRSTATLDAAIDRLRLMDEPDFAGTREETRRVLSEGIRVERADQTYVLDISVFSHDPGRSARIAQALAEAFVDGMIATKVEAVRQASRLIDRQIAELRTAARAAQEKLEAYKRDQGLVSTNGRLVDEDTLRQLNDAYVAAQVRTREAKARRDGIAAALKSGDLGSIDVINSTVISRLKIEAAQASRTVEDLSQQLGPSHPRLIAAKADVARIQSLISGELKAMAASAARDYDVALAGEVSARQAVGAATAVVSDAGEAGITLKELENEATLRADLYRNYSARTAEIGLQANTQISDARVIVPADVPLYPYAPRKVIVLGLAGIAGLGLGLSLALYRGRRLVIERLKARAARPVPTDAVAEPDADPAPDVDAPTAEAPSSPPLPPPPASSEPAAATEPAAVDADASPIVVLAELELSTAAETRNRLGRVTRRGPRDVLSSAVELAPGRRNADGEKALARLVDRVAATSGAARRLITLGVADTPSAAAVAYGLADVAAAARAGVLLVDASYDDLPLWQAFAAEGPAAVVDVIDRGIDAADTALCLPDRDITVVTVGAAGDAPRVDAAAAAIAALITELSGDYGQLILHFGHRHSLPLLEAMIGAADAVLVVAESLVESDPESRAAIADLAAAIPGFAGLVLVDERRAARHDGTEAA